MFESTMLSTLEADQQRAEAAAQQAEREQQAIATYEQLIGDTVRRLWNLPPNIDNSMRPTVQIQLLPTGELVAATIVRSSGNASLDRSVIQAIERAGRFRVPDDIRVFERSFRRFNMTFVPEV
ncbi:TonB C-terminal domain-containing protein [Salinispirillum sp. LH 10-3-1]|uniref:TonB C-terminal domain-containing protein n=1 Tax=Salinispirillum sp. LH 10-3-1 TaxID=2952525 RepID=A0AB38YD69_9GAMM